MTARIILAFIALGAATLWISSCNSETEPTVQTLAVSSITGSSATSGGTVSEDGGSEVIGRGICWNTLPQPNINNSFTSDGAGLGSYSSEITELKPNTLYYVRAYATNSVGTSYGDEVTFTTLDEVVSEVPTVQTLEVTDVAGTSAQTGGTVTDDGGSAILARGVCWNTLPQPNINNSITTNGSGDGSFTSEISGLERGTKYYVRAYATNENGTGYGNEIEFTTSENIEITIAGITYMMHEEAVVNNVWGPEITTGATSFSDGKSNTKKLAALSSPSAAKDCSKLSTLGYNDWYLPSTDELDDIYAADSLIFPTGKSALWSSSEGSEYSAYMFTFNHPWGGPGGIEAGKTSQLKGFCVRIKE